MGLIYKTPTYQALVEAVHAQDHARISALIEQGIAETSGAEQATWLHMRWGRRWVANSLTCDRTQAWTELMDLLRVAPGDPEIQHGVVSTALSFATYHQDLSELLPVLSMLRPNLPFLINDWFTRYRVAELFLAHRRWGQALAAFRRVLAGYGQDLPERQKAQAGRLVYVHLGAAMAAISIGDLQTATEHVGQAEAMYATRPEHYFDPEPLDLARAELALHAGDSHRARAAIQQSMTPSPKRIRPQLPVYRAQIELMAARIARADGNMVAFTYFAERALGICQEHRLKLTERTVRAVMAGADH